MKPLHLRSLSLAALALFTAQAAQAQLVYGEIGYSELSTRLSVPALGLSASARPTMGRVLVGVSPFGGLALEALAAGSLSDARLSSNTPGFPAGRAKVNNIYGLYVGTRLGLGPVELFGRAGWAQSELAFDNLGSSDDRDFSYGGGLRLKPGKGFTLSADYMNYLNKGGARIEGYTLSVGYEF